MTNEMMMNMEKIIKNAENKIANTIFRFTEEDDGYKLTESTFTVAVYAAVITEASKANPSEMAIENMKLALEDLVAFSKGSDWSNVKTVRAYCCSMLYLNGKTRYTESQIRNFVFNKEHYMSKDLKQMNTLIDITLKAMNLK